MSGHSSNSRSGSDSEERGRDNKSNTNTPPSPHAIWSTDTVGNDFRTGFHSASRPTTELRPNASLSSLNSAVSVPVTRWTFSFTGSLSIGDFSLLLPFSAARFNKIYLRKYQTGPRKIVKENFLQGCPFFTFLVFAS